MAAVAASMRDAESGAGRLIMIKGPAGIGKTELLSAAVRAAADEGVLALRARGAELESGFPFGVTRQLFEPALTRLSAAKRRQVFSGAAGLAEPLVTAETSELGRPDADLFPLLHSLYWLCANLTEGTPQVLAIDDAHWADPPSIRWLDYLARRVGELPLLVVIALRESELPSSAGVLQVLEAEPSVATLKPDPLSDEASRVLIGEVFGAEPDPEFARAMRETTGGNPFYLRSLATALVDDSVDPTEEAATRVREVHPEAVSRSVLLRLKHLGDVATLVARSVAILGDDAPIDHCAALAGLAEPDAAEAADRLASAAILDPRTPLAFAHPIIGTTIYEDIPRALRARLHAEAAALLHKANAPRDRVAPQLLLTDPAGEAWRVTTLREAAAAASRRGAPDVAASYLTRALTEPPDEAQRSSLLRQLGWAEWITGVAEGPSHLAEALEIATDRDERHAAAIALARAISPLGHVQKAVAILEAEIDSLDAPEADVALQLEATLAGIAEFDMSVGPTVDRRLDRLATSMKGDTPIERMLLGTIAFRNARAGNPASEVIQGAELALAGDTLLTALAQSAALHVHYVVLALLFADHFDLAESTLRRALADALSGGDLYGIGVAHWSLSNLAYRRGDVSAAIADGTAALNAARETGYQASVAACAAYLSDALLERGDLEVAEATIRDAEVHEEVGSETHFNIMLESRGRLRIAQGRFEDGLVDLRAAGKRFAGWAPNPAFSSWRSHAALALAQAGLGKDAERLADEELELARRFGAPRALGMALRARGLVAEEGGIDYLRQAVEVLDGSGAKLEHARALTDLGAALRRANQRADARELLKRGMELAHRCGSIALAERGREELAATGARPRKLVFSGVDSLTPSELRVARMAAEGMSNPEIAQALFVTRKTVETHLGHAYQKLDISSRKQLPEALAARA